MLKPTNPPSTMPPVSYDDPGNNRFCGFGWGMALANCSFETHCPSGNNEDCPKGQSCHGGLPNPCNIVDLWEKLKNAGKPSPPPTRPPVNKDDPRNTKFCGRSWELAESNCSLDTHCPDDQCPPGSVCYGGVGCSAFDMTTEPTRAPTMKPTNSPTSLPPTVSPSPTDTPTLPLQPTSTPSSSAPSIQFIPADDIRHSFWCGRDWADVTKKCFEPCTSGQDTECSDSTMKCIAFTSCRPSPKPTKPPTKEPTPPTTPQPSVRPTEQHANEVPISSAPTSQPISDVTTNEPTKISLVINENISDEVNTSPPTNQPSPDPTFKPTVKSSEFQTNSPTAKKVIIVPSPSLIATIGSILVSAKDDINEKVLLFQDSSTGKEIPSQRYLFDGFINALGIVSKGHLGSSYFYLGQSDDPAVATNVNYGLVNVALFISQAAVESVKYDVCDEVSWETDIFGRYPLANSCGQSLSSGVTDSLYDAANQCTDEESSLACPLDPAMTAIAESKVMWDGAPPPLECFPGKGTGAWDSTLSCTAEGCSYYDGQVKGNIDPNSIPASNSFGQNNVEGCCWWGRGAFPRFSAGTCMIGKLNYFLGKRAYHDGRSSARYKEVDFCKDPSAICRGYYGDSEKNAEIRWMMGILYWIRNVQTYKKDGFSFMEQLNQFVDSGLSEPPDFFDDVSRIVSRGCHLKSCGNVVSGTERKRIFDDIILYFANAQEGPSSSKQTLSPTKKPSMKKSAKPTTRPTTHKPTSNPTILTTRPTLSVSLKSDSTLRPTASPVAAKPPEYTSDEVTNLTMKELELRLNFSNNYCATSLEEVESKCATELVTCNFGQPLCPIGQACFGNVLCYVAAQFIAQTEIVCRDACLRPLTSQECESGSKMGAFVSLPNCLNVRVGEFCESNGDCGDASSVGNCHGGQNVFMRVDECHSSFDSIASTGDEIAVVTQNQTASTPIFDGSSIATIPTVPVKQHESDNSDEDASLMKAWWKDELNMGSIMTDASLKLLFTTSAVMMILQM